MENLLLYNFKAEEKLLSHNICLFEYPYLIVFLEQTDFSENSP